MLLAVVLACVATGTARAGDPLDKASFTATPAELLAAAQAAPTRDAEVVVLRDETELTFDGAGRETTRSRTVFVVRKSAGIDDWGTREDEYVPYYQDKPMIRIRVVASDGTVAELDPTLVTDAPAVDGEPDVLSDRHVVRAPLPHLSVGAVVEQEIIERDHRPLLSAGIIDGRSVGRVVPVQRTILTIHAPTTRPIHIVPRGFTARPHPKKITAHGITTWTFDLGPTPAHEPREDDVPGDIVTWPWLGVSTAASWGAVADDYRREVEHQLGAEPFAAPDGLRGANELDTVSRTVAWLHQHVRYTGIEFSDAEIVPWAPAETVKRGFGDCKDKATLLVALLRSEGIHADVALLDTGPGVDVARDLPGMGEFDHAIVRALVGGKPLWIDATEDALPPGQLPARDLGRLALIIAPGTRDLTPTPPATATASTIREVRTYHLAEYTEASVTERETETGTYFDDLRVWYRDGKHDDLQRNLSHYAQTVYKGQLSSFSGSDPADLSRPFELTVEIADVDRAFTSRTNIDVYLFPANTLSDLPGLLTNDQAQPRKHEFQWFAPHIYEIENRLVVPTGYTIPSLSPHEQVAVGTMTLTTDRRVDGDTIVITYRLDTGKPRLTAAEVEATRTAVLALQDQDGEHISLPLTSQLLLDQGHHRQAIAECRRLITLHPKEALHHDQLAEAYRQSGMGLAARRAARDGVAAHPDGDAYDMLGFELQHDTLGRDRGPDADRAGAIAAYRKALELDPEHLGALSSLASLLATDADGYPTDLAKDRSEAISRCDAPRTARSRPTMTGASSSSCCWPASWRTPRPPRARCRNRRIARRTS